MTEEEFIKYLTDQPYHYVKKISGNRYAGIMPLLCNEYRIVIVDHDDMYIYREYYDYDDNLHALLILELYDGTVPPIGWIRHGWIDENGYMHREKPEIEIRESN